MILFCSAARFNESVNAFGTLESAESGGLALPVSGAPMFNYHTLLILIHLLLLLLAPNWRFDHGRKHCCLGSLLRVLPHLSQIPPGNQPERQLCSFSMASRPVPCLSLTAHRSFALHIPPPPSSLQLPTGVCLGHRLALTCT